MDSWTRVGVDGSPASYRALDWAADRVAVRGGGLEALCAVDLKVISAIYGSEFDPVSIASDVLAEARRRVEARQPRVVVKTRWVDGRPARELVRGTKAYDLIVVGTDKLPEVNAPRVGTLPLKVAARAECVVAVIPAFDPEGRSGVIAGVDLTSRAHSALSLALVEATWLKTQVHAVHAWGVPEMLERDVLVGAEPEPTFPKSSFDFLHEAIREVADGGDESIVLEVVRQNPSLALIERARTAQLLVVSTRGRGKVASTVLGSVCHDVLQNIASPVMVVGTRYDPTASHVT
ncbi:universal stress protein [Homoserinimonas sp. OAct 916]|uniref:universal stress protein n=1 Tax=Homoserinimonas sp. OAct 916 TaxID=2211450 RepID=UPI000DBE8DE7|nr:universal stress protein [Homoserinimonas sp. OAct 916]